MFPMTLLNLSIKECRSVANILSSQLSPCRKWSIRNSTSVCKILCICSTRILCLV